MQAVGRPHLTFTLDLREPVEIEEFAKVFAGLGGVFDDYLKEEHPQLRGVANLYVSNVHEGSIVAILVPAIPDMIGYMESALTVLGFGALFSKRIRSFISGSWLESASKSELNNVTNALTAIASAPTGTASLETITYTENGEKRELVVKFTSSEARAALETIENQRKTLEGKGAVTETRVLMIFERPGKSVAGAGKKTGERAVIEALSSKPLPLVYASDMVENIIKEAFNLSNVFKQGFVVDVYVETRFEQPIAYRIMHLHQIIDLPDDED